MMSQGWKIVSDPPPPDEADAVASDDVEVGALLWGLKRDDGSIIKYDPPQVVLKRDDRGIHRSTNGGLSFIRIADAGSKVPVYRLRQGSTAAATKVAATSMWNAKCVKCGKGVYNGFTSSEHEGGGCP